MPAEEGYPAYLATRLAEFYERAGAVVCLGRNERSGSVSIVGAVSPAGGDFSEPITQHSLRLAGTFWGLDTTLARQRHFPSINWNRSYTLYELDAWFDREVSAGWSAQRAWALDLLQRESSLLEIVQLLGTDSLAPAERVVLESGQLLREDFLQQSAFDDVDAYCALGKQYTMLRVIRAAHEAMEETIGRGVTIDTLAGAPALHEIARMRSWAEAEASRARRQPDRSDSHGTGGAMSTEGASLLTVENRTVSYAAGPLLFAQAKGVGYNELVDVVAPDGAIRRGQVLAIDGDRIVVQVLAGTAGLNLPDTSVRVRGEVARTAVGLDLVGRILDGSGQPIDGGPPVQPDAYRDVNGSPINPVARDHPNEFIETGISAIDGLNTLVRGQKLPIFSGFGLPAAELAAQIAAQATVPGSDAADQFVVVFAAMGVTQREAGFFRARFAESAALERTVLFLNVAEDPAVERLLTPRAALTVAEHLAFDRGSTSSSSSPTSRATAKPFASSRPRVRRSPGGAAIPATCTRTSRRCSSGPGASAAYPAR